jgi:hypothetical protein
MGYDSNQALIDLCWPGSGNNWLNSKDASRVGFFESGCRQNANLTFRFVSGHLSEWRGKYLLKNQGLEDKEIEKRLTEITSKQRCYLSFS